MTKQNNLLWFVMIYGLINFVSGYSSVAAAMDCHSSLRAGTVVMINNSSGQFGTVTSTITFSTAMSNANHAAIGYKTLKSKFINDFSLNIVGSNGSFTNVNIDLSNLSTNLGVVSLSTTTLKISCAMMNFTGISYLQVSYMAFPSFVGFPQSMTVATSVKYYYPSATMVRLLSYRFLIVIIQPPPMQDATLNYNFSNTINKTNFVADFLGSTGYIMYMGNFTRVKFMQFWATISMYTTTSIIPSITSIITVYNNNQFEWNVSKPIGVALLKFQPTLWILDQGDGNGKINAAATIYNFSLIVLQINQTNPSSMTAYNSLQVFSSCTFVGLNSFSLAAQSSTLDYKWQYTTSPLNSSFSIINAGPHNGGYNSVLSTIITYRGWTCPNLYPYFNFTSLMCQNGCGDYTFVNSTTFRCLDCYYTCLTCSAAETASTCTSCAIADNRNLSTSNCICLTGYFEDGYSHGCRQCSTYSPGVSTCSFDSTPFASYLSSLFSASDWPTQVSNSFTVISCFTNYFLVSNECRTCSQMVPYCSICTNSTSCTTCNSSAVKYTNNKCYLCGVTNCTMCSADNVCATCVSNTFLVSGICKNCSQMIQYCSLCANSTSCTTCNSSAVRYSDGKCYLCSLTDCLTCSANNVCASCAVNTFLVSGICKTCSQMIPYCTTCANSSSCTTCNSSAVLYSDGKCYTCSISNCTSCSADNVCASCSANYFIVSNICKVCSDIIPYCSTCSANASTCTTCNSSAVKYTDGKCYTCSISNCVSCSADNICASCSSNYFLVSNLCKICSDMVPYCSVCTNSTSCTTCNSSAVKYTDNKCYTCSILNCLSCSADNVCASCNSNYFLVSNLCKTCSDMVPYCSVCTNSTSCATCNSSAVKYTDDKCYTCSITSCISCSADNTCVSCMNGYQLVSNTCANCSISCNCQGYVLPIIGNGSCSTLCGDGYKAGVQQCDDSNINDHDGCSSLCKIQTCSQNCSCGGYIHPLINNSCSTFCGDNIKAGIQQCDDGNTNNHDGCSSICKIQLCIQSCQCGGWSLPYVSGSCQSTCGDGIQVGSQQCDDGNNVDNDGCSSACINEHCDQSCACGGYYFPFVAGKCSTSCGDGFKVTGQQCDDGNINNHDGCDSSCFKQIICTVSCQCDGWISPFFNGSCSTLCGDGLVRGKQTCDDSNTVSNDGCDDKCQLQATLILSNQPPVEVNQTKVTNKDFLFFTQAKTEYASLGLFMCGFRIVGMQMLYVFQNFQLLLQKQQVKQFVISYNIHGYSDSSYFPFKIPYKDEIFGHFNYMYLLILGMFMFCALIETLGSCMKSQNKIANLNVNEVSKVSPYKKKTYKFDTQENSDDVNEDFTVHYQKKQTFTTDLLSESSPTRDFHNQSAKQSPQNHSFLSKVARYLLRQVFFDMIMNVQQIVFFAYIQQIIGNGFSSILNFPSMVTFVSVFIFMVGLIGFSSIENKYFGQNQQKFRQGKSLIYWIIVTSQKIIFTCIISISFNGYLYVIISLKFLILSYFMFNKIFFEKIQNYRNNSIQLLHLILLIVFTINTVYLQPSQLLQKFPQNVMFYAYAGILGIVFTISMAFMVRQLFKGCSGDLRGNKDNQKQGQLNGGRIFQSRRQIEMMKSSKVHPINNQITSTSIIDDIRTKKLTKNQKLLKSYRSHVQEVQKEQKLGKSTKSPFESRLRNRLKGQQRSINKGSTLRKIQDRRVDQEIIQQDKILNNRSSYEQTELERDQNQNHHKQKKFMKSSRRMKKQNQPNKTEFKQKDHLIDDPYRQQYGRQVKSGVKINNSYQNNEGDFSSRLRYKNQKNAKSIKKINSLQYQQKSSNDDQVSIYHP